FAVPQSSAVPLPASSASRAWVRDPRSAVALAAIVVAAAGAVWSLARPATEVDSFPARLELNAGGVGALSPDGRSVVFVGRASTGNGSQLHVRRLDQLTSRPIPGTENVNAIEPVFSPDGREIVFVANRRTIVKVPFDGAAIKVAEIGEITGG